MQVRRFLSVGLGVFIAAMAACDSVTSIGPSFGGSSVSAGGTSSAPGSSGTGQPIGPQAICPAQQPVAGDRCGLGTCEYGGAADPACNFIAKCNDSAIWDVFPPDHCPTTCPARFDERVPGEACDGPDVCTYREATCGCAGATGQPPTLGDGGDEGGDAATADSGGSALVGHWQCVRPGDGCPARRPVIGTACTKPMTCDYGTCLFGVPLAVECNFNTWIAPGAGPVCQ